MSCSLLQLPFALVSTFLSDERSANTEVSLVPTLQLFKVCHHSKDVDNQVWGNQESFGSLWQVWKISLFLCPFTNFPALSFWHTRFSCVICTEGIPLCNDGTQVTPSLGPIVAEGWSTGHKEKFTWTMHLQLSISTPSSFSSLGTQDPIPRLLTFWHIYPIYAQPDIFGAYHTLLPGLFSPESSLGWSFPICSHCIFFQGCCCSLHTGCPSLQWWKDHSFWFPEHSRGVIMARSSWHFLLQSSSEIKIHVFCLEKAKEILPHSWV